MKYSSKVLLSLDADMKARLEAVAIRFGPRQTCEIIRRCIAHGLPKIEKALEEDRSSTVIGAVLPKRRPKVDVEVKETA